MLKKRVEVFQDFMASGKLKELTLDGDKQDVLIKVEFTGPIFWFVYTHFHLTSYFFMHESDKR